MKRILFVDDEQRVLDGLRDLLRRQRKDWDMVFALGGKQAVVLLDDAPFDVVVSDMRMPGMDGVALLQHVKDRSPATARLILSGHADREAVLSALPVAHQFISKPCDADQLRSVVDRVCGLQKLLQDATVRAVVGNLDRLLSAPRAYFELTRAAERQDSDAAERGNIVEQDAGMSAKVLQLVNSSYFGLARKPSSVAQAVAYLGAELVKGRALSIHVFSTPTPSIAGFSPDDLQRHSVMAARCWQERSMGRPGSTSLSWPSGCCSNRPCMAR